MTHSRIGIALFALALMPLSACYEEIMIDDPDGSPPPFDAAGFVDAGVDAAVDASVDAFVPPDGKCIEPSGVDLLFVVDGSNSMTEEQASLADGLPNLVRLLVEPPDEDGDLEPDWLAITDLRVGVVTVDMGTGGFRVPTCAQMDFGDDGVLRTEGSSMIVGCSATTPPFLLFDPMMGMPTPEDFAFDVSCVTSVGTGGCGFEQQLEATLKALSPAVPNTATGPGYIPPRFFRDTTGHADGANAGFVREDSLLAAVIVSDEGDCSALDPELFNPSSMRFAEDLNLRCAAHPEALHPVSRYVDGLAALRAQRPDLLALGLIVGVPTDLAVDAPTDADFAAILADPRMEERVDPGSPTRLIPSCDEPGRGFAFPPRRMVSVARGLGGGRSTVQSICQGDFMPAAGALARLFGSRACTTRMGE